MPSLYGLFLLINSKGFFYRHDLKNRIVHTMVFMEFWSISWNEISNDWLTSLHESWYQEMNLVLLVNVFTFPSVGSIAKWYIYIYLFNTLNIVTDGYINARHVDLQQNPKDIWQGSILNWPHLKWVFIPLSYCCTLSDSKLILKNQPIHINQGLNPFCQ